MSRAGGSGDHDRDLVLACRAGDAEAFAEIVKCHYESLYAHAMRRLGERDAAEDAVQDAFLRAYRALPTFGGDFRLRAWLHRILGNVCIGEFRRRQRQHDAESWWDDRLAAGAGPEERSLDAEAAREVAAAIAALPPSYREALVLRDLYEMEYADMADQAGITEQNARARVARARAAVRRTLGGTIAAFGGLVPGRVRQTLRWGPRAVQHLSTAAASAPDLTAVSTRTGVAASTLAAAALAAVAVVPLRTVTAPPSPAAPVEVEAMPGTGGGVAVAGALRVVTTTTAPPVAEAAESASSTSTSTTSTSVKPSTVVAPKVKLAPKTGTKMPTTTTTVPPALGPLTISDNNVLAQEAQPATYAGTAELPLGGVMYAGSLTLSLVGTQVPSQGCTGEVEGSFVWEERSGHEVTLSFQLPVTRSYRSPSGITYLFSGSGQAQGDPDGVNGQGWISGSLDLAPDGTYGSSELTVGPPMATACPVTPAPALNGASATTSSSTTTSTSAAPSGA
jgi:RNA polymerase sigma-70 factor (ECF subfamily)